MALDRMRRQLGSELVQLRQTNAAWQLLASPLAPYVLTCLKRLFEPGQETTVEDMEQSLAELLEDNANRLEGSENYLQQARREIRDWIRRRLIGERGGKLFATDELQRTLDFVEGLQSRIMTSTASRLATVQREIADLALQLSPDARAREERLLQNISELEAQLTRVRAGQFEVRSGESAIEGIREVYDLATSLLSDFRRVEDSYREAERTLRQSLITDEQHRGQAVDRLLDSHDELVKTTEGQVFSVFHQQLNQSAELEQMRRQLREIARHELVTKALSHQQTEDMKLLLMRLMSESRQVIQARTRSDRDVKGFIRSGAAVEHFTIGRLLQQLSEAALELDWSSQKLRRTPVPLPVVGANLNNVPTPARLRITMLDDESDSGLDLTNVIADLDQIDEAFWDSFDSLDRQGLYEQALQLLSDHGEPLTIGQIAARIVTSHDLESVTYLINLAREANVRAEVSEPESFDLAIDGVTLRYSVPALSLDDQSLRHVNWERG